MKTMVKVYAARSYTPQRPRVDKWIEVNAPNHLPTLPKDDQVTKSTLTTSPTYFENTNFPNTQPVVTNSHFLILPLLQGTKCPAIFPKGTPFLLVCPTEKIEEGYLIFI